MRCVLAAAMVVVWPAGCGNSTSPSDPPHAPTVTAHPPKAGDCGSFVLTQGQRVPTSAMTCLIDAAGAQRVSRLQVTRPTVEGDPITTTYVIEKSGVVHVAEDATLDQFGDGKVHRSDCTGPTVEQGEIAFDHCA